MGQMTSDRGRLRTQDPYTTSKVELWKQHMINVILLLHVVHAFGVHIS